MTLLYLLNLYITTAHIYFMPLQILKFYVNILTKLACIDHLNLYKLINLYK